MNLVVYPQDIAMKPDMTIEHVTVEHIRYGLAYPQACETVVYVDLSINRFKVLKCRHSPEFVGVVVDGTDMLVNFI